MNSPQRGEEPRNAKLNCNDAIMSRKGNQSKLPETSEKLLEQACSRQVQPHIVK
jgi:hypothetical protein